MDVSFQPKSQQPEKAKTGPNFSEILGDIKGYYIGEKKSIIIIVLSIFPVLLIAAVVAMISMNSSMASQVNEKKAEVAALDAKVTKLPMGEIRDMSNRLKVVSTVVNNEPFVTSFFKFLEYSIEDDILFKKTDLSAISLGGNDTYTISIDTEAQSYAAVVNQMDTLKNHDPYKQFFSDVKLQNLSVDRKGVISFKIVGNVNIKHLTPEVADAKFVGGTAAASLSTSTMQTATSTATSTVSATTP